MLSPIFIAIRSMNKQYYQRQWPLMTASKSFNWNCCQLVLPIRFSWSGMSSHYHSSELYVILANCLNHFQWLDFLSAHSPNLRRLASFRAHCELIAAGACRGMFSLIACSVPVTAVFCLFYARNIPRHSSLIFV